MGFENSIPASPPLPVAVACECALPATRGRGAGTLWRCDRCKELWILNPYDSSKFGLATLYEHVFWLILTLPGLCTPYLFPETFFGGRDPWRGWRRVRYMRKVTAVGTVVAALICTPVVISVLSRPW